MNAHAHGHDHHQDNGHDHDHGHGHGHHHHVAPGDAHYGIAIALNLAIVAIEAGAGVFANSTALIADAGHNLSDVLGLVLAGGRHVVGAAAGQAGQRTYGFGKATVLAALINGVVLMLVCGGVLVEAAVQRLMRPEAIHSGIVMITAGIGVVINTATALMFMGGRKGDVNVRGVFLHMAGDALVSVGVIIAAGLIALTGWSWLDPAVSIAIVLVIVISAWGLLREAVDMALGSPRRRAPDVPAIEAFLSQCSGVTEVHDLHVWSMSTTEMALTAHLVRPDLDGEEGFRQGVARALEHRFGVRHATL